MRHAVTNTLIGVRERVQAFSQGWDTFWFTPSDPTLLGVLRVLTGLMLLYTHGVWGLALNDFYGPDGWLSAELVRTMQEYQFACSFWWWVEPEWMNTAHAVSMVILALFTVGLFTRVTSVLSLIVAISYAYRVPEALFGLDQINVMLTLYLTIGDAGKAVSLDRGIARWRGAGAATSTSRANLGRRLIQVHMCVIYFFAGISKLQGLAWWNGEAMWLAFSNLEYQSMDMTWLAWHPLLINVMTHTTIIWEISFCALIWNRACRPLVLIAGTGMHLGIGLCLGMWTFGLIMLVGCASFLPLEGVRALVASLSIPRRKATLVRYPAVASPQAASSLWRGPHRAAGAVVGIDYGQHGAAGESSVSAE